MTMTRVAPRPGAAASQSAVMVAVQRGLLPNPGT